MMLGDDVWALLVAITGDADVVVRNFDPDNMYRADVVDLIEKLREERDHLRNQLAAAREQLDVMTSKRAYLIPVVGGHVIDPWLVNDLSTLRRLLVEP